MCCHPFHMFCEWMGKVWPAWDITNTLWSCSLKPQSTQAVRVDLVRSTRPPSHHQDWACCYVKNHRPWMCYQVFPCFECMDKVQQAWNTIILEMPLFSYTSKCWSNIFKMLPRATVIACRYYYHLSNLILQYLWDYDIWYYNLIYLALAKYTPLTLYHIIYTCHHADTTPCVLLTHITYGCTYLLYHTYLSIHVLYSTS